MTGHGLEDSPIDRLHRAIALARRTRRWAWVALAVFAVGAVVTGIVALARQRLYRSETVLQYREPVRSTVVGSAEPGDPGRKYGLKLQETALSRDRLNKVIEELGLYSDIAESRGPIEAVEEMRLHVTFKAREGDAFRLTYDGQSPDLAQKVTARLAELLVEEDARLRLEDAKVTKEFLVAEKKRVEVELLAQEVEVAGFLAQHPDFALENPSLTGGTTAGVSIRVAEMKDSAVDDSTLLSLELQAMQVRQQIAQADSIGTGMLDPALLGPPKDPALIAARSDAESVLQSARKDLATKLATLMPSHPDVVAAKGRVAEAERAFKKADAALAAAPALSTAPRGSGNPKGILREQLSRIEREVASNRARKARAGGKTAARANDPSRLVELETKWTQLNRTVAETRERYKQLEDKHFRASIAESLEATGRAAQMVVIDPAFRPMRPVNAGRKMVLLVGGLLSLAVAGLAMLGCALIDDGIRDRHDLERLGLGPVLAVVPADTKGGRRG